MREIIQLFHILVTCILLCACVNAVSAEISGFIDQDTGYIDQNIIYKQVLKNHTVFFGEEHVDVTDCVGTTAPTYVVALDLVRNVTDSIHIPDPENFTMPTDKPENFWYRATDAKTPVIVDNNPVPAFTSQEPVFSFEIWDLNADMKVESGDAVKRGNVVQFKMTTDTNLDDITTRRDYDPARGYINFKVNSSADGDQFYQLMTLALNSGTVSMKPTTGLDVNPSPGWTWPENLNSNTPDPTGWMTGWRDAGTGQETDYHYKLGSYSVIGVCNVNNMFKNRQLQGYTWDTKNLELTERSVTVSVTPLSGKSRDGKFTAIISGNTNTAYQLFITDDCPTRMTGQICDRPPFIIGTREELLTRGIKLDPMNGPYVIGNTPVVDCCKEGLAIREALPSGDAYPSNGGWEIFEQGTRYYAEVTTDSSGMAEVPFWVDTTIAPGTFMIQVQDVLYQQKSIAKMEITAGQITASTKNVEGKTVSEFFLGDEIWIDGTNSDSNMTYIWITGPGLDPCGVNLFDPTSSDPVQAVVLDSKDGVANYWRITPNWATIDAPISAGSYTIWVASSYPDLGECTDDDCLGVAHEKGICILQNCPHCAVYEKIPVRLKQPGLSVDPIDDVKRCCCPGYPCGELGGVESILINGSSGGNNCKELQIWMFSQSQFGTRNYLFTTTPTFCDDTFQFDLNRGLLHEQGIDLCQIATGRYDVVVQVPGANGIFDITRGEPENGDRYVTSTLPVTGSKIFKIEGKDALSDSIALKALLEGLNKQGIDDRYAVVSFNLVDRACEGNVDFTADRNSGNSPLIVQFTDTSVLEGVSWAWYRNGELFSEEQNPRETFTEPGKYTIRLEVTDAEGFSNSATKDSYITVLSSPVADFSYGPQPAGINDQIQFTDQSTGAPTSWMWEFGDGATSSLQSPAHAFAQAGTYNVTLTVSNAFGVGQPITKAVVVVNDKPVADFVGEPRKSSFFPATVSFTDLSTGVVTSWEWKFERSGQTVAISADKNPVITFTEPGIYSVTLTVSNNGGSNTKTETDYIIIGEGSIISLAPGYNHVSIPRMVTPDLDTVSTLFAEVDTADIPFAIYGDDNGVTNWTNVSDDYKVRPLEMVRVYSNTSIDVFPTYITGGFYSKNLAPGWSGNGIGIMAMQPTAANLILAGLGESWDKVLAFKAETQRWEPLIIRGVNDDQYLYPTVGYIIEMNGNGVLTGGDEIIPMGSDPALLGGEA